MLKQWNSDGILTEATARKLSRFLDLLLEWNARINLTGLRTRSEMEEILIGESIFAARTISLSGKSVLDVGSGAGIPGLVWAIDDPTIRLTSLEIREKKVTFQKEVQRVLGLEAVEIVKGMFPAAVMERSFDVITTRAVRFTSLLHGQALSRLNPRGILLRFAGAGAVEHGWESRSLTPRASLLLQKI